MPRVTPWKPRSSSLGYYWLCDYRAAFDRALAEGALELPEDIAQAVEAAKASSPYADLGTCIHHHLQAGIGATFPRGAGEAPKVEIEINASKLFRNDLEQTRAAIRASAVRAVPSLPVLAEGVTWMAETVVKTRNYSGHIDLLSSDSEWLVDLKTTSRPPVANRAKFEHLLQVLAYAHGLSQLPKRGMILYVDSIAASWALPCLIDFHSDDMMDLGRKVVEYAAYLRSAALYKVATPRLGHVCEEWCPYTTICRDRYRAPTGEAVKPPPIRIASPV
jgi:hypothetical protein